MINLHKGAKTKSQVNLKLSKEPKVKVEIHKGSLMSPFIFAVVVDVVTELTTSIYYVNGCRQMT